MDKIPRWRNLNHFSTIMTVKFTDGTKYEDISKVFIFVTYSSPSLNVNLQVILFALHNVLINRKGRSLLQSLRSYLELNMYASLEVHTDETIAAGRGELKNFSALMKVRIFSFIYMNLSQLK